MSQELKFQPTFNLQPIVLTQSNNVGLLKFRRDDNTTDLALAPIFQGEKGEDGLSPQWASTQW